MPPAVRPSLRHRSRFTRTRRRRREIVGALAAQGCIRQSRSISAGFTGDAPNAALGNAIRVTAVVRVPRAEILAALAPRRRLRTRQSVAPAAAAMLPQNSFLCAGRAIYSFSPHPATKQL
jgi:hypothetical protein